MQSDSVATKWMVAHLAEGALNSRGRLIRTRFGRPWPLVSGRGNRAVSNGETLTPHVHLKYYRIHKLYLVLSYGIFFSTSVGEKISKLSAILFISSFIFASSVITASSTVLAKVTSWLFILGVAYKLSFYLLHTLHYIIYWTDRPIICFILSSFFHKLPKKFLVNFLRFINFINVV